jgi:chemotaxis protein methyltransferase CheR
MLYFNQAQIERTVARFHKALGDNGALFVGPTEVDQRFLKGFTCRRYDGTFFFRKGVEEQEAGTCPSSRVPPSPPKGAPQEKKAGPSARQVQPPPSAAAPAGGASCDTEPETSLQEPAATCGYPEALALYQTGRYEEAAGCVRRALDAGPQTADTLALGARAYANVARFSEAREFCEQAIAADRLRAQSHYLLSIILEQQGDAAAAATSLRHALYIDHDYLLAYFALGNLCRQAGDEGESERNFANALRLLEVRDPHEVLPEAEGMTAGRLAQMIRAMTTGRSVDGKK